MIVSPARLRITRKMWTGRGEPLEYQVVLDGTVIGAVRNGATTEFEIGSGHHEMQLKIRWGGGSRVIPFSVSDDQTTAFECEPFMLGAESNGKLFDRHRPTIELRQVLAK